MNKRLYNFKDIIIIVLITSIIYTILGAIFMYNHLNNKVNINIKPKYKGIGIKLNNKNQIEEVIKNSPASYYKLEKGDTLVQIDLIDINNKEDIINIKKENYNNNYLNITIKRNNQILSYNIKKEYIYQNITNNEI